MHPSKVDRNLLTQLTDLPNIGKACAAYLHLLGFFKPQQLIGVDPYVLYESICLKTGVKHDPCMIDTFISITRFMDGEEAKPWWAYTAERKQKISLNTKIK
ncbi:helix-hairpin-helix domain-containing protein [Aquirhabdus parva]|uniref:Mitomycin resistance protein n=1 Tax=Aquirhabdus parva TaxID=2283318 RepID=A0A345P662_9GAMM|nr:helix-hairpin-helix domain-containing protein [Aquirhabdus parva]AXI02771.1 mitomycin resistance protein [Aquirhabdus parva]